MIPIPVVAIVALGALVVMRRGAASGASGSGSGSGSSASSGASSSASEPAGGSIGGGVNGLLNIRASLLASSIAAGGGDQNGYRGGVLVPQVGNAMNGASKGMPFEAFSVPVPIDYGGINVPRWLLSDGDGVLWLDQGHASTNQGDWRGRDRLRASIGWNLMDAEHRSSGSTQRTSAVLWAHDWPRVVRSGTGWRYAGIGAALVANGDTWRDPERQRFQAAVDALYQLVPLVGARL